MSRQDVTTWWRGIRRFGFQYSETRSIEVSVRRDAFDIRKLSTATRGVSESLIRGACQTAYLHDRDAVCRCLGRYRMFVSTDDIGLSTLLMLDGYWEMSVTEAFVEIIKPGFTVVDCGANLGYYSLLAADLVGAGGHVHSFEPQPELARRLRASLSVNGFATRSTLHSMALGDVEEDIVLNVPQGEPKNAHWTDIQSIHADPARGLLAVPQRRLDQVLKDQPVDFVKIDVEGSEQRLWLGMAGLLARRAPLSILIEFAVDRYQDPAAFLDDMLSQGFGLDIVTDDCGIQPITREQILNTSASMDQMLLLRR